MERFAVKLLVCSIALVMALLIIGLYLSIPPAPTAAAFIGAGCGGGPPSWGNWDIAAGGCACENEDVTLNGNLTVNNVGFNMTNCTIRFNSTFNGEFGVSISGGATFTMLNNSAFTPGENELARFTFVVQLGSTAVVTINNSEIRGAGFSGSGLEYTGVFLSSPTTIVRNTTIHNGYNGIILSTSNTHTIDNNTIIDNDNMGIFLNLSNFTNITNNTVMNNGGYGIFASYLKNLTIYNNVLINNSVGLYLESSDNTSITYNHLYTNRGDAFVNNFSSTNFPIEYNTMMNNSGWAVWTNENAAQSNIRYNTMCHNNKSVYWALNGAPFGGNAPMNNFFCVNLTYPGNGTCGAWITEDHFTFEVSNNPTGMRPAAGNVTCKLFVDGIQSGQVSLNASSPETGNITNSSITEGLHTWYVACDPEGNVGQSNNETFGKDKSSPQWDDTQSDTSDCGSVKIAVYWYDNSSNVSYAFLSTNETGEWKNYTDGTYGSPLSVDDNESWTNFTWWNSSLANQIVYWQAWAVDCANNWNSTGIHNFTGVPCAEVVVGVGGAAGPPAPPPACSVRGGNMTLAPVSKGQIVSCYLTDTFRLFNMTFAVKKTETSKIIVQEIDQPEDIPMPTIATYKYFNISTINLTDADLSRLVAEFIVPNEWTKEKNVLPSAVGLFRWDGLRWETQPTWVRLESINNTYFYASLQSIETNIFAIAAGKACPACPAPTAWSECINGTQARTEWTCSEETEFDCANFTRSRRCACLPCPQPAAWSDCINNTQTRTVYNCSEETGFECVPTEETRECRPALLIPTWEDIQKAPLETKVAIVAVALSAVGAAAYWYLKIRKPARPWK